jgi:hypothetical protein
MTHVVVDRLRTQFIMRRERRHLSIWDCGRSHRASTDIGYDLVC